jgi:hypothetical protein
VKHRTAPGFWKFYESLPVDIQKLADVNFELLKSDSRHPSIHFKKVDKYWSARVGIHYRALAMQVANETVGFWIGHHSEYSKIV